MPCLPCCLWYCPQGQPSQGPWNNGYSLPPTTRKCSYVYPAEHSSRGIPPQQESASQNPPSSAPVVPRPSPQSKQQHNLPNWVEPPSPSETTSKATPKELPVQRRRRKCSSIKPCQGVARKPSAGIPNWCKGPERITTKETTCALTARLLVTWQMFFRA